jgi:hypothetical protein
MVIMHLHTSIYADHSTKMRRWHIQKMKGMKLPDVTTPLYYEVPMVDAYENDITMVDAYENDIIRIPEEIRLCDLEAYEPKAVCIGPYFHSLRYSPNFRRMEQHKCWCVNRLLQRSMHSLEFLVQEFLVRLTQAINKRPFGQLLWVLS